MTTNTIEHDDPTAGVGLPRKYHGFWIWPIDGYYDVHYDEDGRCGDDVAAEMFHTRDDAKAWIDAERYDAAILAAVDRALAGDR